MPNKDSFTFSDKLRKSKSVPLSKRLPSIVGGQNKQKRTLVQRAQRDLPFILVAACALLLLPFLSRNGNDDITGPGNFDWNREGLEEPFIEGGGGTLEPTGGMKDPLDLILTPRSALDEGTVTPGKPDRDVYGTRDRERTDYSTRRGYDDDYRNKTTTPPATSKFGKTARPAVRKSVERTPTKTRELRVSQVPTGRGATSTSHSLPIGQAPKSEPSGATINPGVRPVALQPMGAHGNVGRSMTGENLYAEAARSIGAMNAGGSAKANLLASQMKDQDGMMSALGPAGAFGGAGSPRPGGAGGGPNNNNGYNIGKPWWWDMMQARSQKWWELFEYKWREKLWTNIYDIIFDGGKQIANCLLFGNKDIDVSAFGGKKAGAPEINCEGNPNWTVSFTDSLDQGKIQSKSSDGKSTNETAAISYADWKAECEAGGGHVVSTPGSRKGMLQVRAECLGFGTKWLKRWKASKTYSGDCSKVNNDPMEYSYSVTKLDKHKKRLENKTVIVLLAKVKNGENAYYKGTGKGITVIQEDKNGTTTKTSYEGQVTDEIAIYATRSNSLKMTDEQLKELSGNYCELTRLVAFVSKNSKGETDRRINDYESEEGLKKDPKGKTYLKRDGSELEYATWKDEKTGHNVINYTMSNVEIGQINAASNICKNGISKVKPFTLDDLLDRAELGNTKKGSFQQCKIIRDTVKFSGDNKMMIENQQCSLQKTARVKINGDTEVKATIEGVGNYNVFAVLLEVIDGQNFPRVMAIHDFNTEAEKKARKGSITPNDFFFNQRVAVMGLNPNSTKEVVTQNNSGTNNQMTKEQFDTVSAEIGKITDAEKRDSARNNLINSYTSSGSSSSGTPTARGQGRVIWIVTDAKELTRKVGYVFEGKDISAIEGSDFVEPNNTIIYDVCTYRWCDEQGTCVPANNEYKKHRDSSVCKIDNECYTAGQLDDKGEELFAIIKTSSANCNFEGVKECTPIFWIKDQDSFAPYKLAQRWSHFLPLKDADIAEKQPIDKNIDGLEELYGMAKGNPPTTTFPIFPEYINEAVVRANMDNFNKNCKNINLGYSYPNADIRPKNGIDMEQVKTTFAQCLTFLQNAGADTREITIYFYGLASTEGEIDKETGQSKTTCDGGNGGSQTPQECNLALSADRALYAMITIANDIKANDQSANVLIDITPDSEAEGKYSFNNTNISGITLSSPDRRYKETFDNDDMNTDDPDVKKLHFIAKALGSKDAIGTADKNRVLLISFEDKLDRNQVNSYFAK